MWVHSFYTRFERPIAGADDVVQQIRAGYVTPMARDDQHHLDCAARWLRREVVEWHESGKDWRAMAAAAGYERDDAECRMAHYQLVKKLAERGATVAQVAEETGLAADEAADLLAVVEEQRDFYAWRRGPV
jgi:hypothetical protein